MESPRPQLLILADAPDAFVELFGISLLERLLRVAQRLGFREALILSKEPDAVAAHLAKPSWARAEVTLNFRQREDPVLISDVVPGTERILLVSAGFYYDARLLKALAEKAATTLLVDSAPPPA